MKQLKQKLAYLLVIAMVFGMALPTTAVKAAAVAPVFVGVTVDYVNENVEVKTNGGEIYYTDAAYSAEKDKLGKMTWETAKVTNNKAVIDFSWMNGKAKTLTIKAAYGMESVVGKLELKAQNKKFKAVFSGTDSVELTKGGTKTTLVASGASANAVGSPEDGYIFFTTEDASKKVTLVTPSAVEFKKGTSGKYGNISTLDLSGFGNKGASLYFRTAATSASAITASAAGIYSFNAAAANPASKDSKLSYAKRANAPKVTLDGSSYALSLKVGQEYKVDSGKWINVKDQHANASGKITEKITLFDLHLTTSSAITYNHQYLNIQVRTAASNKKLASKTFYLDVASPEVKTASIGSITSPTSSAGVSVGYQTSYDKESGLLITNNTEYALQVAVVPNTAVSGGAISSDFDWAKQKWTALKAKDSKAGTVKISKKTVDKEQGTATGAYIFVRPANVKATKTTDFQVAGSVIKFDLSNVKEQVQTLKANGLAAAVTGVTTTAITTATEGVITVKASTGEAISFTLNVEATGLIATSPKAALTCVPAVNTTTKATKPSSVVAVLTGPFSSGKTGVKVTIAKGATASTSYWRVNAEGADMYFKLVVE